MDSNPAALDSLVVLVANRGEIARRIIRTCTELGIESVAVFADPDADAPHVHEATKSEHIGPAALDESYLSIDAILDAAERSSATHIHPGYGFLAERADFADAVIEAGLVWVGPSPDAMRSMASKIEARNVAVSAGVPIIEGYNESQDPDDLANAADDIGYPVLIKASAGGGGKGIRIANTADEFADALQQARNEAMSAFGDDDVIVERYVTAPRHIEVQIVGDHHGHVIDVGTRECSVQRRYQKVLEEAPAPNLPYDVEKAIRAAAVKLATSIDYDSAGTVEFIVDADTNEFFFLEMNTRIQVEHTVTEQITGLDLISAQLAISTGIDRPPSADFFDNVRAHNPRHSFEARITAEDAWNGHIPQTGVVSKLTIPDTEDVRWDAAITAGSEITPYYDSMVGKLIVTAPTRIEALDGLRTALSTLAVEGLTTNIDFLLWLTGKTEIRAGMVTTRFLDETPLPRSSPFSGQVLSPWSDKTARRLTPHSSMFAFDSPSRDDRWHGTGASGNAGSEVLAPFPGLITEVMVSAGDEVAAGQPLMTIEAMKMLHPITAAGPATIDEVLVTTGDQVDGSQPLLTFVQPTSEGSP